MEGLITESNSSLKCNNISESKLNTFHVRAIRTDTCLIVYHNLDCRSPWSKKSLPGISLDWIWNLRSFHICNDEDGGSSLNLDITQYYDDTKPTETPQVIESYKNVLSCVNVPKHVQQLAKWSINNHGNDLLAYFEPNCSETIWKPMYFNAGNWNEKRTIYSFYRTNNATKTVYKILSFGPSPNSTYFTNGVINLMVRRLDHYIIKNVKDVKDQQSNDIKEMNRKFDELENKFVQFEDKLENFQRSLEDSLEKHKEEIRDLIQQNRANE